VADLPPAAPGCQACAARDGVIAALQRQLGELQATVARLERMVSRNSGNSSMPPSTDDLPGRKPPSRQQRRAAQRAARKRGKQPGAPGAAMTWEEPDEVVYHHPRGPCGGCGADLAGADDLGVAASCQQLEIPLLTARRIQHDLHAARCGCGRVHVAARPGDVPDAAVSMGPSLRALAVYLVVFQHVPIERCARLIEDVTGAQVSAGFVHSCLATAAGAIADVVKLIKTLITAAYVAGFDETTLRSGPAGTKRYVLGAFTERYSALFLGERTLASFREFGILPSFASVVVSDRYQNYFHDGWQHLAGHQACCSHLLRDFEDAAQCWPARSGPPRRSGRCAA
jgi:transposase